MDVNELQLVSNMIMCGDHPSITKTELNAREPRHKDDDTEKQKDKEKEVHKLISYGRISPTSSHTHAPAAPGAGGVRGEGRGEARRRARPLELSERADVDVQGNRALVQAAIGSFRWPPYLVCVWVVVLVLTHALHCLVAGLERALPALRKICQYFRAWTESAWREGAASTGGASGCRLSPLALGAATGALYTLHAALYAVHAAATWAVEPLCCDVTDTPATLYSRADLHKVTNYDEINSKINLNAKQ